MFCEKCGRPIPEGQQSCGFCNPPSQQPVLQVPQFQRAPLDLSEPAPTQQGSYIPPSQQPVQPPVQQPVWQEPVAPPVQQPVWQEPVQQNYAPPAQQNYTPPVQQPAFELNMPAEGSSRGKKKGGGKIALIVIALVLVAGIVLAAINWNSIVRFFNRNFGEPVVYLQDVEKENVAAVASDVAAVYDQALSVYHPEGSSVDGTITLEAGSQLMTLLGTALSQSGVNVDLSWVENIVLEPKLEMYEDTMRVDLGLGVNNTHLATASAIWDLESQTIFVGVPELHDTYIQMDATEILGSEAAAIAQTMAMSRQISESFMDAMPEGSQVEALINKYFGIIIDGLSEAEKDTETVKAGGLKQNLTVLTVELSQKELLKIAIAVLEEAKDDETIEEILDAFGDSISQMGAMYGGEIPDLFDAFSEVVDEGLENLEYMVDEVDRSTFLTIETFLDSKDTIAGRTFTIEYAGEELSAHYITVTEGDEFAFDAELDTMSITGEGTIKDGKRSGSYTLTMEGMDYATLEIEDYACPEDGPLTGTFRLIPSSEIYEMMDMDSSVTGVLGQAAVALTLDGDSVILGIELAGSELISLGLSGSTNKPSQIALPNGVSTEDDEGGMKWLAELNFDGILDSLEKAGVPSEYVDMAQQVVEMFTSEFG